MTYVNKKNILRLGFTMFKSVQMVRNMKKFIAFLALILLLVQCSDGKTETKSQSSVSNSPASQSVGFKSVSVQAGKMLLDNKKNIILLDVRTPQEVQQYGTIAGGNLVPFWAIMQNKLNIPTDTPIMVFCAVGGRSYFAGQTLVKNGYREVYNLKGGIDAWKKVGYPLVR